MFERLDESAWVLDVRGVLLAASAYVAVGSVDLGPADSVREWLLLGVYAVYAGAFARGGGRRWVRAAALHSALAVQAAGGWAAAEGWVREAAWRLADPELGRMNFALVERGCFEPSAGDVAVMYLVLALAAACAAVPVGWVARRLVPVQEEW